MVNVYASGIHDLTVARYVAAMNVAFIGYRTNAANKPSIIEMMNWVEGPKTIVEVEDADFIDEAVISIPCHFVYDIANSIFIHGSLSDVDTILPEIIEIQEAHQLDLIRIDIKPHIYFSSQKITDELLTKIDGINCGILLPTGSEESLGIKSFDELEDIFEKIENLISNN